jgi:hypothetical protein
MLAESAIILSIDRLGAGFLGPYGNTWIETPEFNRLASQSLLCEHMLADSPHLESLFHSYWSGRHAVSFSVSAAPGYIAAATQRGLRTVLVTDEQSLLSHPLAADFAEQVFVPVDGDPKQAREVEETQLARLFEEALATLRELDTPFLLWIHSRGMSGAWDAPATLREQFAAEDDPLPGEFITPPEKRLTEAIDPDELLKLTHAYAGQVAIVDLCLGALLAAADEHPLAARTLLAVTSPRGYPLGEHGRIGPCDNALYGELLQTPLLVRIPGGNAALVRSQQLVQPSDLGQLLRDIFTTSEATADSPLVVGRLLSMILDRPQTSPEITVAIAAGQRAIRTPAWFQRESEMDGQSQFELFAKPDDRWEVNEIASRAADIVAELSDVLDQLTAAANHRENDPRALALPDSLTSPWR